VSEEVSLPSGDQFYVTHCASADSVLGSPGYSIRAASVPATAPDIRRALEYPSYELPLELWPLRPARANTPRRLARTFHPESGVWVAHSVYLEKDTMNRDRAYFTHLIHLPATTDPAAVLRSWDAPGWVMAYPPGAPQRLPRTPLPMGTAISDATLTRFLSRDQRGPDDVARLVCPLRLRTNTAARRDLVARLLQALVLTLHAEDGRDHLYVHAEPGLVAMLLYAAVRLLPPQWTADLTFSTFEPYHKGLRDYKLATVIGTYFGVPRKALGTDLTTVRGYGLDTLEPERSSPELATAVPPGLRALVDLAANGDWELLQAVHRWIGAEADALDQVVETVALVRSLRELERGTPTIESLLTLQTDPRGEATLAQAEVRLWPIIRGAARTDARVRRVFGHWLTKGDRIDQIRRAAIHALQAEDLAGWESWWSVVRDTCSPDVLKTQTHKNLKYAVRLPTPAARQQLRLACLEARVWPDHHLLAPMNPDELDVLLDAPMPADWRAYSCLTVMGSDDRNWLVEATLPFRDQMRERVRRYLLTAPVEVLASYADHARSWLATMPGLLDRLLQPHEPMCVDFLSRLITAAASRIEPSDWVNLLSRHDIYGARTPEWAGFLLRDDHLAKLLTGFQAHPAATTVWANYLKLLSAELLDGDEWETMVFRQLQQAADALTTAGIPLRKVLPESGPGKLTAARTLRAVHANPSLAAKCQQGELLAAYQVFGVDPVAGLRQLYLRHGFHVLALPQDQHRLAPFLTAFLACYPVTTDYFTARTAVTQWLALSESCEERYRAEFQLLFIRDQVPPQFHRDVLQDCRQMPLLPEVVARLSEPGLLRTNRAPEFPTPVADKQLQHNTELTAESDTPDQVGYTVGTGRRRDRRLPGWLIPLLVVLVVAVGLAVAKVVASLK
jgi:hypothetical protein